MNRRIIKGITSHPVRKAFRVFQAMLIILAQLALPLSGAQPALAAGGDFSVDFAAAAPFTYDHLTGGGAFNDGTIGKANDVVESLEGGDFTCGDTVTYLAQIRHTGPITDDPQTLELQFSFLANTTGQPGAAHSDVTFVGINYGPVQNGAGAGGTDSGNIDDGGSTATIVSENFVPAGTTPFNGADELILVVQIDDLEAGEEVILRIDVALTCDPGSSPTGNLQAQFNSGRVVAINDDTPADDTLTGGEQTIPFKQIGDLVGAGEPLLRIEKTVTTAGGVCPGGETLTVNAGDTVKYCYSISNPGTADLFDVEIMDDNGTPGNTADDFAVTISGLFDLDGDADLGDLASGATATGEALVTLNVGGTIVNTAQATGNNGLSGGNFATLTESDTASVTVEAPQIFPPDISITKTASPTSVNEPGGDVTFTFTVVNASVTAATLNSLVDTVYGDLNGMGDCSVPQPLAANGGSYSCSFSAFVSGSPGDVHTNVVTASASNDAGSDQASDDATVTINDLPSAIEMLKSASPESVDEPGGNVTFTFTVNNLSTVDSVTINSLTDSIYGDLNGQGTCSVPQTIQAGGSYSCSLTTFVSGNAGDLHTNIATASGVDDDGQPVSSNDDAAVAINDVPSAIAVFKTASPESVDEPGGDVTFTFNVNNLSTVDSVTINSLTDSIYGDLDGQGTCSVPQTIPAGDSYSCDILVFIGGNAGDTITNVLTVSGLDDDGNPVGGSDDATVTINDVPSSILVSKSASPTSVPETGGNVTYTVEVKNTSAVDTVTINAVQDSLFGNLSAFCAPALPADLAPGESVTCSFTEFISGEAFGSHTNVASAAGVDDDGNPVGGEDSETVTFEDVAPQIALSKTASPTNVPETGGYVTFTFRVDNTGQEDVSLISLSDSVFGDLNNQGTCSLPQDILIGGFYECSITVFLAADDLAPHYNLASATAVDDDGTQANASDDETVTFEDVAPQIALSKTASPTSVPETGSNVTFTFRVDNTGQEDVSLTSLSDSAFGDLNNQGTCSLPQDILISGFYECSITVFLAADDLAPHYNLASATAVDDDGTQANASDDETVSFIDVQPDISLTKTASPTSVFEPGADVTFTFVAVNNSAEAATLNSLVDSIFGDLNGQGDCSVPQPLAANGGSYTCSITVFIAGNAGDAHLNIATATASDNDGNSDSAFNDAAVTVADTAPAVSILKEGPASINEGGDSATYDITITNDSVSTDPLTITSLVDDKFGDLLAEAEAARGGTIVLNAGEGFTFQITRSLEFNVGDLHTNTVSVIGVDDEGTQASDNDDHTVAFNDVAPLISVTKTADQAQVFAPGEDVPFSIKIDNNSASTDPVTINSLVDSIHGDLNGQGTCSVPQTIQPGESYSCSFAAFVDGDETNVVTASGADDEGSPASASDDAFVDMINPSLVIEKATNGFDADAAPGPEILASAAITWEYVVTNDGDVDLTNISVVDDVLGAVCTIDSLAAGASTTCFMSGSSVAGQYANLGSASASYTDADGNSKDISDDDASHYFGANPSLSINKVTADAFGNMGDGLGILPGSSVTWYYTVENDGNVALDAVNVTDDQGVIPAYDSEISGDGDNIFEPGEIWLFKATGSALEGWYNNIGTASASYTDAVGNPANPEDSDSSSYFGLVPGAVTNSSLCDFGDYFNLVFTPDMQNWPGRYKLSDSNPGQFFYNLFYIADGSDTVTIELPYPFVTQGGNPIHAYSGVFVLPETENGTNCYDPRNEIYNNSQQVTLDSYTDTNGDGVIGFGDVYVVTVSGLPTSGFVYLNMHLDYGLEKTNGWDRSGDHALNDPAINPALAGVDILHLTEHLFDSSIAGSADSVWNTNTFKNIKGFGGLVMTESLVNDVSVQDPMAGARVQLFGPGSQLLEEMISDENGWYQSEYVHKGKEATYSLKLIDGSGIVIQSQSVTVGKNLKFGEANFIYP